MVAIRFDCILCMLLVGCAWSSSIEESVQDRLYTIIDGKPCVVLHRATGGSVGCSSGSDGVTGLLYPISSNNDIQKFLAEDSKDRIAVVSSSLATPDVFDRLSSNKNLVGVLILPGGSSGSFSAASKSAFPSSNYLWNPAGTGLINRRYQFPIVYVDNEDVANAAGKAKRNQVKDAYPYNAAQMFYDMGPEYTSQECIPNFYCEPLGGNSVWASMGKLPNTTAGEPARDTVLFMAQLDATATFHELVHGADTTVSSLVALLTAFHALSSTNILELPVQVVVAAFQGEMYGRLGSRLMYHDLTQFKCQKMAFAQDGNRLCRAPLRSDLSFRDLSIDKIMYAVPVDQIGHGARTDPYYIHKSQSTYVGDVFAAVGSNMSPSLIIQDATTAELPPTPSDSFLEFADRTSVLAGYDDAFVNKFWNSRFDNISTISVDRVAATATLLSRTMYALATGDPNPSIAAAAVPADLAVNPDLVSSMLNCILVNQNCELVHNVLSLSGDLPAQPMNLYTGLFTPPRLNNGEISTTATVLEGFVRNFLANASYPNASSACNVVKDCTSLGANSKCIAGRCVLSNAHYHDAHSLALYGVDGFSRTVNMSRVSEIDPVYVVLIHWSCSWSSAIGTRLYEDGGIIPEAVPFVVGIALVVISIFVVYRLHRYLNRHFKIA